MTTPQAAAATEHLTSEINVMQLAFGALVSQAVYVAAKINVADHLAEKPLHISRLAAITGMHERSLYRLMRSLSSVGVFAETDPHVFALTPAAEPLRSDAPNSLRNGVIFMGEEWHWQVWGNMYHSVQTGQPAWGRVHGAEVFDYFAAHHDEAEVFNRAMTDMSIAIAPAIVEAYDFSGIGTLADIAGGHGYFLSQILRANQGMRGILFDTPEVTRGAAQLLAREGVADRVDVVAGNFFEKISVTADAYLMKHIIHDWDDERCLVILRNIGAAMKSNGRLLIVENVVPAGNEPHLSKIMDLEMLVSPGGIERTAEEYRVLLRQSGFELTGITPTASPYSIIEGVKIRS